MSFGADVVGQALDAAGIPMRVVRRVASWIVIGMFVVFPVTARHGLTDWANRQAKQWTAVLVKSLPQDRPAAPVGPGAGRR